MFVRSRLIQDLVRRMWLDGLLTQKLGAANGSTMEVVLEKKTTLKPKKSVIKDAHQAVISW